MIRYRQGALALIASVACSGMVAAQDKPILNPSAGEVYERPSQGPEGTPPATGPAPSRTVRPAVPAQTPTGKPFEIGSFLLYPELVANWMYDSNLFYTNQAVGDHAMIFSPAFWLQSNWGRHALNFYASSDITRYSNFATEDTTDWRLSAEGRYDIDPDTNVYGGLRRGREHQDRESPDFRNGISPTRYYQDRAYGGFFKQFDRVSVRVAGTWQHLDYDDVAAITGSGLNIINNDDRDRDQYTGGVRVGYEVSPRIEPYVLLAVDNRRYDNTPDDAGFFRNSDGQRYIGGARWNVPKTLKLDVFAGYMKQDYDDPRLKDVSTPTFGGSLVWAATDKLRISVNADRTVEETTLGQQVSPGPPPVIISASSYTNTYVSAGGNYRLTNEIVLQGNVSYSEAKYNVTDATLDRTDDYYGAGVGLVYRVARNFYVDVNYGYRNLHSSVPGENFIKRQTFVGLAFPLSN